MKVIEAVTFDYWNTLAWEQPGQLVECRLSAWTSLLDEAGIQIGQQALHQAHELAFDEYQRAWIAGHQYVAADAMDRMLAALGLEITDDLRDALLASFDSAGAAADIRLAAGVTECLATLRSAGVKLGIVCDVGLTPSRTLLGHLDRLGLGEVFDTWAFSDEVGVYKPDSKLFDAALQPLGVAPPSAAHVGDRLRTDVAGARAFGMVSVRYAGIYDDPERGLTEAHHVITDYGDLCALVGVDSG